jgi:hypothetical protein
MPETIRALIEVRVAGGPTMTAAPSISVGAYDKVSVTVAADDGGTPGVETVPLQPGTTDQVALLLISSSRYHDTDLSYVLGGATISLDGPQLFTGGGMMSLFTSDPDEMVITNGLDVPVTVSVLVARSTS